MKTTNEIFREVLTETGFGNYKPSEMSNSDYWMCTEKAMEIYAEQFKIKAEKWDKLGDEIGKYYENDIDDDEENDDEEFEGSLLDIGETAAIAFGYL